MNIEIDIIGESGKGRMLWRFDVEARHITLDAVLSYMGIYARPTKRHSWARMNWWGSRVRRQEQDFAFMPDKPHIPDDIKQMLRDRIIAAINIKD